LLEYAESRVASFRRAHRCVNAHGMNRGQAALLRGID
jgi:hypothetical protein